MEEQHAVPQDITGFQFKLVGDMTLKQFGELAFGAIVAYLFYASNWNPFLKWPLAIFFGFLGVSLAFFPVEERPLDVWIINFLKAIYRPTYYVWKKDASGVAIAAPPPQVLPKAASVAPPPKVEGPETTLQTWPFQDGEIKNKAAQDAIPKEPPPPPMVLSIEELQKLRDRKLAELSGTKKELVEKTEEAKTETYQAQNAANIITVDKLTEMREKKTTTLSETEVQLNKLVRENTELLKQIEQARTGIEKLSGQDKTNLQTQVESLNKEKDGLATAIADLRSQIASSKDESKSVPSPVPPWASGTTGQSHIVDRPVRASQTIPLTDVPNVINGTVFDQRGAPMEGAIVIIKDKAGNSVRALKTNRIGQFIVSTPLDNGSYYLEFELANYVFNVYEVVLDGKVVTSLEIRGKYTEPGTK